MRERSELLGMRGEPVGLQLFNGGLAHEGFFGDDIFLVRQLLLVLIVDSFELVAQLFYLRLPHHLECRAVLTCLLVLVLDLLNFEIFFGVEILFGILKGLLLNGKDQRIIVRLHVVVRVGLQVQHIDGLLSPVLFRYIVGVACLRGLLFFPVAPVDEVSEDESSDGEYDEDDDKSDNGFCGGVASKQSQLQTHLVSHQTSAINMMSSRPYGAKLKDIAVGAQNTQPFRFISLSIWDAGIPMSFTAATNKINTAMYKMKNLAFFRENPQSNSQATLLRQRHNTSKSMSHSILSDRSTTSRRDNGIKLPFGHYNDRRDVYLKTSRALSEKSIRYQSKDISYSERKKINQSHIEKVIKTRASTVVDKGMRNPTLSMPNMHHSLAKEKLSSLNARKYAQLSDRKKQISREKKMLMKQIEIRRKESSSSSKWSSPFRDTNTFKSKFEGKNIISNKLARIPSNPNPFELKVLNIDRMFRKKDGKLSNIMPIPMAKLDGVMNRSNMMKTIKRKDAIHSVIDEYNKLLRICKLKKTAPRIGVKGRNFTRAPTLEELMGIKVHQFNKTEVLESHLQYYHEHIEEQIFQQNNQFYKKHLKHNRHLTTRLFAGLKQEEDLNLAALTRFYAIFINKVASHAEKVKFLCFFFIPAGQDKIDLQVLKLILELMCEDLPPIGNLTASSEFLSKEEKSKIFLQALNRVLFADLKEFATSNGDIILKRSVLEVIFQGNEDAVDLLIKLLLTE